MNNGSCSAPLEKPRKIIFLREREVENQIVSHQYKNIIGKMDFSIFNSRSLSTDDDLNNTTETNQMLNTFYINIIIFCVLSLTFECSRSIKSLYLNRLLVKKYVEANRVPKQPSICPYSWIFALFQISDQEVCRMVG